MTVPYGTCHCGCGALTARAKDHDRSPERRYRAGEPRWFVRGHQKRGRPFVAEGYVFVRDGDRRIQEHRLIAQRVLGRPLPGRAVVHHVDEDRGNNANTNLVICEDQAYHGLLHRRTRAYVACGQPSWRRCFCCGSWDDPARLRVHASGRNAVHPECARVKRRARYEEERCHA